MAMGDEPTPAHDHAHDHDHPHAEPHEATAEPKRVEIKRRAAISAVWLVPLIALGFGAWLAYSAYVERGIVVTLRFASADGIVPDKTEVRYKGVNVGKVTTVTLGPRFERVDVEVEMRPETRPFLTDKTLFWRVSAQVSATGVSELQTLLSGDYIAVRLDKGRKGKARRHFVALKSPPPLAKSSPGLHLVLLADSLDSISYNTRLFHRGMVVGHVTRYAYDPGLGKVRINVVVDPDHAALVRRESHFWNTSGIDIRGGLGGIEVRTGSLATLLAGGIAFDTPAAGGAGDAIDNGAEFPLARGFEEARMGHSIRLILGRDSGVHEGTPIRYQGITIGRLRAIEEIDIEGATLVSVARIDPRFTPYLSDRTQFFVVTPRIGLSGIAHLDALVGGPYITLRPRTGKPRAEFRVLRHAPPLDVTAPGLHLRPVSYTHSDAADE